MMKLIRIFIVMMILFYVSPHSVQAEPSLSAHHAVVIDMETGEVLFNKDANSEESIASITKIMTAIVAIEHGDLNQSVEISQQAANTVGSSIYTKPGDHYPLRDLIYGLMLRSGNDAAVAIAEHIAGSEGGFAYLMNEKADWLGMTQSQFQNPHGLDEEGHYSSALDMAKLTRYAMNSEPVFREIFGSKTYQSEEEDYPWHNKNKLLMTYDDVCTGGKTGYTSTAGRTLVTTAKQDHHELVVVTIDAKRDWQDHKELYEYGFEQLEDQPEIPITFTEQEQKPLSSFRTMISDAFQHLQGGPTW